jgi:16S rRNA (cytidine1402-2'-O)-methyltransferase
MAGTLYLVATPIGNLSDISKRAGDVLGSVMLILCEDTRHSGKLLSHLGIKKKLLSLHDHNEEERIPSVLSLLETGEDIALISDAGTPGISDPGHRVVRAVIDAGFTITSIPGPVAFVNALIASGLPTDAFFFGGFLPSRKNERRKRLEDLKVLPGTLIFYETPHRIDQAVADCLEVLGDRRAVIARELTKLHEEFIRGSLSEITATLGNRDLKGEMVLMVDRSGEETRSDKSETVSELVAAFEKEGHDPKSALKLAAKRLGVSKSEAYRRLQMEK